MHMQLEEFTNIIEQSGGLLNDLLAQRLIPIFFNQGLMLQKNELDSDSHLHASYLEFLEAYARVCDEASLDTIVSPHNAENDDDVETRDNPDTPVLLNMVETSN